MNLLFRLVCTLLFARFRAALSLHETCVTSFRVAPTDLDVLQHMNNGIYFSLQDLARVDMMIRSGMTPVLSKNGWYPVVVAETIQFKKSLKLFERFSIYTRVVGWNEKQFILEHVFERKGEIVAYGLILARFLKKTGGSVSPEEILKTRGFRAQSPPIPPHVQEWLDSGTKHGEAFKSRSSK